MRVLCVDLPPALVAELLSHGAEVTTPEILSLERHDYEVPHVDLTIHRDQPSPKRAAPMPASLLRRSKRP